MIGKLSKISAIPDSLPQGASVADRTFFIGRLPCILAGGSDSDLRASPQPELSQEALGSGQNSTKFISPSLSFLYGQTLLQSASFFMEFFCHLIFQSLHTKQGMQSGVQSKKSVLSTLRSGYASRSLPTSKEPATFLSAFSPFAAVWLQTVDPSPIVWHPLHLCCRPQGVFPWRLPRRSALAEARLFALSWRFHGRPKVARVPDPPGEPNIWPEPGTLPIFYQVAEVGSTGSAAGWSDTPSTTRPHEKTFLWCQIRRRKLLTYKPPELWKGLVGDDPPTRPFKRFPAPAGTAFFQPDPLPPPLTSFS